MNLRRRTLITIAISLVLLVLALYVISQSLLMGSLSEIQDESTQKDLESINDLLFKDLDELNTLSKHWAAMGESSLYDEESYALNPETKYIFNSTGIDFVIISSSSDGVIYYDAFNSQNGNLSDDLKSYLAKNNSFPYSDNPDSDINNNSCKGILLLSSGTYLVSSNPISGSQGSYLILGRSLEFPEDSQLTKIPGLSLEITPFITGDAVPTFHDVNRGFSYSSPIIIKRTENDTINGFSLLRNSQGRAIFQVKMSENLYVENKGQETLIYSIISFLVIGLVLGFVILIYLDRIVLFRVNKLSNQVQEITKTNDLSQRLPTNGTHDEISKLSISINSLLISLQRSWNEIQQSRMKYRNIFYNTGTAMIIIEEDGTLSLINSEFENLSGFKKAEVEDIKSWEDFFPEDIEKMRKFNKMRKTKPDLVPRNYEARFLDNEGKFKDVHLTVTTIPGTKQLLASLMDITLLKKSLKEKDALLREIHHRVKNNMQIMISLLNMKARHTSNNDLKGVLLESQNRIRSMAMVHDGLYHSQDMIHINIGEYIQRLTAGLFASHNVDINLIRLKIKAEQVMLNIDTAVPLGLLINELVSNSIKHAFKPGEKGTIKVELFSSTSEDEPTCQDEFTLIVEDDGIGLPEDFDIHNPKTMGMKLIDALTTQLEGKIKVKIVNGTRFEIQFKELNYMKRI
ncbi:histidine kinase dimerization/phosphoacceptor domain -containing protein [Methanobacterium petrolearium]|uniref:histidine kinase dimerization/phosphoacceptor domain -containing protein n=1 Tax=Methanobacterium petrolearium TaxID=710190 RepID=UPI001AEACE68|nr:histidine kinase dimerization/phosphoacceptor domain -containing protein [Methanobacterium petrolearium]MBP1945971.1 PAS domain S-box-containing protein [Methanobacterium petrolearium]BDZ72210.1 hypothetical protein GCM10025861_27270 [Methanobacterium petrolearium]